jgi:hypothetical protein
MSDDTAFSMELAKSLQGVCFREGMPDGRRCSSVDNRRDLLASAHTVDIYSSVHTVPGRRFLSFVILGEEVLLVNCLSLLVSRTEDRGPYPWDEREPHLCSPAKELVVVLPFYW